MTKAKNSHKLFILPLLMLFCTFFYYFGELADWAAWENLRQEFFYGIHDVHRLLFLAPIIYAGYVGRVKGAIIITLVTFIIFLPRAFFISPYPDPLLRMVLFTIAAGVIGSLTGIIQNEREKARKLQSSALNDRESILNIIDELGDGAIITGPDFKIRFMNSIMIKDFGEGIGSFCYKQLYKNEKPCEYNCFILDVIKSRQTKNHEYTLKETKYKVISTPYTDVDGAVCQLSIFRKANTC
jgi:hypothetical protein